jgi:hypothetical protein
MIVKAVKKWRSRQRSALVTQEIEANYEPHYHHNKEQPKSDHITDIHGRYILRLIFRPALGFF